jgi:hypothetical protein
MSQRPSTRLFEDTIDEFITKAVSEPFYASEVAKLWNLRNFADLNGGILKG